MPKVDVIAEAVCIGDAIGNQDLGGMLKCAKAEEVAMSFFPSPFVSIVSVVSSRFLFLLVSLQVSCFLPRPKPRVTSWWGDDSDVGGWVQLCGCAECFSALRGFLDMEP